MPGKFSNLLPRVLVALVGVPALLFISYTGGVWFLLFVLAVSLLALHEFFGMARAKGANPMAGFASAGTALLTLSFFHERIQDIVLPFFLGSGGISFLQKLQLFLTVLLLFLFLALVIELFRNRGSAMLNAATTVFGVMYVGVFLASFVGIRELYGAEFPYHLAVRHFPDALPLSDTALREATYAWGGLTVIAIFVSIWSCDTAAYFGGLTFGKHKLFPRVSPNKSWEGALFGFAGAVAAMMLFADAFLPYLLPHQAAVMGVIIGVFGQVGDLVESLLKRDAGIKDSSVLIPGHGGVLDRFDSLIFVAPVLYLYIDFVVLS